MKKQKTSQSFQKPLGTYPVRRTFLWNFFNPKVSRYSRTFIKEVWNHFFIIQQKQKFKITRIPVVNVEHPLDETIPFVPKKVGIYLDFVGFFIRILSMIKKCFPKSIRSQKCAAFIEFLTTLYHSASTVYSKTLTTTERPHCSNNFHFWVIYTFDAHFLCVPSLHISIVAGSFAFVRRLFETDEAIIPKEEKDRILNEIYKGAINIAESVLFIKQHSINCVASALYMLTAIFEDDFFPEKDTLDFVDALFRDDECIDLECIAQEKCLIEECDKTEIRNYIANVYKKLLDENRSHPGDGWQKPILDFLSEYKGL